MQLRIDPGFRAILPALDPDVMNLLARNLSTDGCREPLVVWQSEDHDNPTILDGHHRYEICTRLGLPFETVELEDCPTRADAIAWIAANQLGRRNLTPSQKVPFALEVKKQLAVEAKKRQREHGQTAPGRAKTLVSPVTQVSDSGSARDQAAALVGVSAGYIQEGEQIEKDAPELLDHLRQGTLNIPQAKKVAALPAEERPAAIERIHKKEPDEGGYIYRDGQLVEVQTNKEVTLWLRQTHQIIDAITALATVEVSPEDYLRAFPPESAYKIDAHLAPATRWLARFTKCWEERT